MDSLTKKQYHTVEPFLGIQLNMIETSKLHTVVNTIYDYEALASIDLNHQIKSLSGLNEQILDSYKQLKERPSKIKQAIKHNYKLLHQIIDNIQKPLQYQNQNFHYSRIQLFKLFNIIKKQWSQEGSKNRKYMITLKQLLKKHNASKDILITGNVLGRLILQLSSQYNINANQEQFDDFLITNYFLNICKDTHRIYPNVHSFLNHVSQADAFQSIIVPDIKIQNQSSQIGISLGSFNWIYRHQINMWDCIVIHFGLQSGNPIKIVERAYQCLKSKGRLFILTKLTYENSQIELSYQQIIDIAIGMGMIVLEEIQEKDQIVNEGLLIRSQNSIFHIVLQKQ